MNGYWVILEGTGGELAREFAETEEKINAAAAQIIHDTPLGDGDVIRVVEGWSERD